MMTFLVTAVLALLVAGPALGQPGETIDVHILEVEAVVLDGQGKPVRGLTQADFEVLVGGRPAPIANFYPVERGAIADAAAAAPSTVPTRLVIFIDDLHLHRRGKKRALDALKKYVAALPPAATAMLVRWNGSLTVRVPATDRREELVQAIAAMDAEPPALSRYDSDRRDMLRMIDNVADRNTSAKLGGDPENTAAEQRVINELKADAENEMERPEALAQQVTQFAETYARETQNTIAALRDVVGMMKGLDGRKTILYVSEGLPLQPGAEVIDYWARLLHEMIAPRGEVMDTHTRQFAARPSEALRHDQTPRFLELVKDAQSARVSISSVDPGGARGFDDGGVTAESRSSAARIDTTLSLDNQRSAVRMVTEETGGRYFADDNDLDTVMAALADQVATYYSLAVRAPSQKRNLAVRVRVTSRNDVRVLTARRQSSALREEMAIAGVRARLYSRQTINPLDARLTLGSPWPDGRGCSVPVQIVLPPGKLTAIDGRAGYAIHAVVLDANQRESKVQSLTRTVTPSAESPIVETIRFGLRPSHYVLSIAIVDQRSGETSYLQAEVDTMVCGS